MIEVERNSPIDAVILSEFFARCGWKEPEAAVKLEWALAASDDWVVCKLDGEMIGFGRACRLSPIRRVLFDLVVDPRFDETELRAGIAHLLTEAAGSLEEVSVFPVDWAVSPAYLPLPKSDLPGQEPSLASTKAYLGKRSTIPGGDE